VRGKKSIGSYFKVGEQYQFWIDGEIVEIMHLLYIQPKL
jgi:hypothetical protein